MKKILFFLTILAGPVQAQINAIPFDEAPLCKRPVWPKAAWEGLDHGTVKLQIVLDAQGKVAQLKQMQSSGYPALDEVTSQALALCSFAQAKAGSVINIEYVWPEQRPAIVDFKTCAKPVWPKSSLRNAESGTVQLKFRISETGRVDDALVATSSGHKDLDEAALKGIAKCSFKPARRNGKPEQAWTDVHYVWSLGDSPREMQEKIDDQLREAEAGSAAAQYQLGLLYQAGTGKDGELAISHAWFHKAAAQNHVLAQLSLATQFAKGVGVARDDEKAAAWFGRAANGGDALAQLVLGGLYTDGRGLPRDPVLALQWFQKAALQGNVLAAYHAGMALTEGRGIARDPAQAFTWFIKAAAGGHVAAQVSVGASYWTGQGVAKNPQQALEWFNKAAAQNDDHAMLYLGYAYAKGSGVAADLKAAHAWFLKSALKGNPKAQLNVADDLALGEGARQDLAEAFKWYERAAGLGSVAARTAMGRFYEFGYGVAADPARALDAYERAAEKGDEEAMQRLAQVYAKGELGRVADAKLAADWTRRASAQAK